MAQAADLVAPAGVGAPDEVVFAARLRLVHEWRKFLFRDPGLPAELLPAPWAGHEAAEVFNKQSARLLPPASRFVEECLQPASATDTCQGHPGGQDAPPGGASQPR
jgi:phenylacetic acid degradation operon negative regulatory protein